MACMLYLKEALNHLMSSDQHATAARHLAEATS
jgi:hypothetical protein